MRAYIDGAAALVVMTAMVGCASASLPPDVNRSAIPLPGGGPAGQVVGQCLKQNSNTVQLGPCPSEVRALFDPIPSEGDATDYRFGVARFKVNDGLSPLALLGSGDVEYVHETRLVTTRRLSVHEFKDRDKEEARTILPQLQNVCALGPTVGTIGIVTAEYDGCSVEHFKSSADANISGWSIKAFSAVGERFGEGRGFWSDHPGDDRPPRAAPSCTKQAALWIDVESMRTVCADYLAALQLRDLSWKVADANSAVESTKRAADARVGEIQTRLGQITASSAVEQTKLAGERDALEKESSDLQRTVSTLAEANRILADTVQKQAVAIQRSLQDNPVAQNPIRFGEGVTLPGPAPLPN